MAQRQSFAALLEKYVLAVADKFIEAATVDEQISLIHLINSLHSSITVEDELENQLANHQEEPLSPTPFDGLERQWQQALATNQPESAVDRSYLKESIALNQRQIESLASKVTHMNLLIRLAENKISNPQTQTRLLAHYRTISEQYGTYLERLKELQKEALGLLNR